ncbi:putative transmembrane protein [Rhodospirillaceae bacterium LM-1]|nr:putative transmembrane protein [Rhodospirillaceae bacterium LM-1]
MGGFMYDANPAISAPSAGAAQPVRLVFSGTASEYFSIWIVNLILSSLTFGIYSAWAKVRNNRYFYGSTSLDGASFEYHAKPMQILKGRLIAFALIAIYAIVGNLVPPAGLALGLLWLFLAPLVINLGLRFNARMSSYRNVHFDFEGSYGKAFLVVILLPIVTLLTAGILAPLAHREMSRYLANGYRFGTKRFSAELPLGGFYMIYFQALGLFLIPAIVPLFLWAVGGPLDFSEIGALIPLFLYAAILLLALFVRAKARNLVFNSAQLEGGHRFASSLSPWRYAWISASNLFLMVVSLGFLLPWARVRMARYIADNTMVIPASDLSGFVSQLAANQQSFGSEMADLADVEIAL